MTDATVAFYAPIKPPDHPIASGDREIARLLVKALDKAGFRVELVSRWISYSKRSDADRLAERIDAGGQEASRIEDAWRSRRAASRPRLVLTYHPYCKAPDFVGPPLAAAFDIPYVTVEACRTNQGINDEWRPWREIVTAGVRRAAVNFCLTPTDRCYLQSILPDGASIHDLPPFVDAGAIAAAAPIALPAGLDPAAPTLVSVAMMRPGAKMASYRLMADALSRIAAPWNLIIIGDGPGRGEIGERYAGMAGKVHFAGAVDHEDIARYLAAADVFVWPGVGEAIGMACLEAQAAGLPVVATETAGIPEAVVSGQTGLLTPPGEPAALAAAIARLLKDLRLRAKLASAAQDRIRKTRDVEQAGRRMARVLAPFLPHDG